MMDRLRADLVSIIRALWASPIVPLVTVATVAIAAGLNLAMLGLIDRALLSPPPHVVEPGRVYTVAFEHEPEAGGVRAVTATTSWRAFETIRDRVPGITAAAAWSHLPANADVGGQRYPLRAVAVSGQYFAMLGAGPALGRTIVPDDDRLRPGSAVGVLSHSLWKRAFGGDPQVVGRRLSLQGHEDVQVVGVMPAGFSGHSADRADLWVPLRAALPDALFGEKGRTMAVVEVGVRLAADSNPPAASGRLSAAMGVRALLMPIIGADVAPAPHRIAYWLGAVSMIVFGIGLANAATLLILRGVRQRRERSIRSALGATRGRLLSHVIGEAAILATAAACAALVVTCWFDELVRRLLMPSLIESTGINVRTAAAAAAGGACMFLVAAGVGTLQLPSHVSAADLAGSRRTWRRATAQKELLIVQTTLAVLLIAGAGMFGRSYYNLAHQDFGIRLGDLLVVAFEQGQGPGSAPDQDHLFTTAVSRVRALPGVDRATLFGTLPHRGVMVPPISVPGHEESPALASRMPHQIEATPELFEILGIPIVQGRRFTAADQAAPVAIVSETMARTLWPGTSALGKCFRIGFDPSFDPSTATGPPVPPTSVPCREVVGVARDTGGAVPGQPDNQGMRYYVPWSQGVSAPAAMVPWPRASGLLVRRASDDDRLADAIRHAVTDGRTDLPFLGVHPYLALIQPQLAPWQIGARLLLLFGSIALAIAAMGLYAAFAHSVAERRHEMAVRTAIGASRSRLLWMMLREGAAVAAMGVACGATLAVFVGRLARSMFVGTSSADPLVLGSAGALMLIVAVVATWAPAAAASRADPNTLLRAE